MDLTASVVTYGKSGMCDICECAPEATASIRGERYCKECKDEKHPKSSAEFQYSDATFKCRKKACSADRLSYRECVIGVCCETALKSAPGCDYYPGLYEDDCLHQEHQFVNKILERARKEKNSAMDKMDEAEGNLTDAKKEVRDLEKLLANARKMVENAEKDIQTEMRKKIASDAFYGKVKKRVLLVTKAAVGDLDEPEAKKKKPNEDNEKPSCKVCFFPFDNDHHEAVIIPCGHKACFNCISKLPEKNCPICRRKFSEENVYKVYN